MRANGSERMIDTNKLKKIFHEEIKEGIVTVGIAKKIFQKKWIKSQLKSYFKIKIWMIDKAESFRSKGTTAIVSKFASNCKYCPNPANYKK